MWPCFVNWHMIGKGFLWYYLHGTTWYQILASSPPCLWLSPLSCSVCKSVPAWPGCSLEAFDYKKITVYCLSSSTQVVIKLPLNIWLSTCLYKTVPFTCFTLDLEGLPISELTTRPALCYFCPVSFRGRASPSCPDTPFTDACLASAQDHPPMWASPVPIQAYQISLPPPTSYMYVISLSTHHQTLPRLIDSRCRRSFAADEISSNVTLNCFSATVCLCHSTRSPPPPS